MASAYYETSRGRGGASEEADDFDEFDPTPYGGGYDLFVTFGRPLPPSEETCYACSEPSTSYDAPHYSASEPSPYGHHAKAKPNYGFRPQQEQQPSYGSSGGGYGSRPEPAVEQGGGYGSGYGRKNQQQEGYGSGGYGSGYGGQARPGEGYGSAVYGSGYDANPQAGSYGRKPQVEESYGSEYGSGYGRKPQGEESYGSGYGRKPQVEQGYGSGYGSRPQGGEDFGSGGYGRGAMVPRGMAMAGRLRRRAMVVLGMGTGRRLLRMKVCMAPVGTGSQSRMGRRHRDHMDMEGRSRSIRVVGMRGRAMVAETSTKMHGPLLPRVETSPHSSGAVAVSCPGCLKHITIKINVWLHPCLNSAIGRL